MVLKVLASLSCAPGGGVYCRVVSVYCKMGVASGGYVVDVDVE